MNIIETNKTKEAGGIISKIIFADSTIFFYGESTISRHSISQPEKFKRWHSKKFKPFTGMFITQKNTYSKISNLVACLNKP